MNRLVIFGAGGHAREVAQIVADINQVQPGRWNLLGFLADTGASAQIPKPLPAPLLGDARWLIEHTGVWAVVAVGDSSARSTIAQSLQNIQPRLAFATLIHPRAWLADRVTVGEGSVVFAGALVNVDVCIGMHSSLNLGCTISHDCVIGNFASIGPGAHLAGGVMIGDCANIGTGATLRPCVRVGTAVTVGAGAVVVCDFSAHCTVVGVPACPLSA